MTNKPLSECYSSCDIPCSLPPTALFQRKIFFGRVKNSERRRFNKTSDYLSPEEEGVGWGGVGWGCCRKIVGDHMVFGGNWGCPWQSIKGGRTIYYCLLVRGWGGIRILQSLRGGSDKFFLRQNPNSPTPPPPPLPFRPPPLLRL